MPERHDNGIAAEPLPVPDQIWFRMILEIEELAVGELPPVKEVLVVPQRVALGVRVHLGDAEFGIFLPHPVPVSL